MPTGVLDGISIRRVRASEWRALKELRLRALRTDPQAFGATYSEEAAFDDARWVGRTEAAATSATSAQWVAVGEEGRLVGSSVVADVDGEVHVFAMWVDPDVRGRGVGAALLDLGLAWSSTVFPNRPVKLDVNPAQEPALCLYRSRGFRATGTVRPIGHTPGVSVVEMVRLPIGAPDPSPGARSSAGGRSADP